MSSFTKIARAKVNLTLHVGKAIPDGRFQGYHPLDSLVVFADFGDELTFEPSERPHYKITGEFAEGLDFDKDNLIIKALKATDASPYSVTLAKIIPVSAGLGGGSANAAAVLRQFDPEEKVDAALLGADVPVCRLSRTAYMRGIGEDIELAEGLRQIHAVLVNPRKAVSTALIFKAFDTDAPISEPSPTSMTGSLIERAIQGRNDLQVIAASLEPSILQILNAIENTRDCQLARMSGSGATCFGIYTSADTARDAAHKLKHDQPNWWVRPCRLGDPDE